MNVTHTLPRLSPGVLQGLHRRQRGVLRLCVLEQARRDQGADGSFWSGRPTARGTPPELRRRLPPLLPQGFRDMNSRLRIYNEFLFQLPRRLLKDEKEKLVLSEAERKELKKHLESIRVELYNTEVAYTRDEVDGEQPRCGF